jgi:threonine aldolase
VFETDLEIFPVATGTAANGLALASASPPYGAIYCHENAHVLVEECGAPEFYTGGAKLIGLPGAHGKIDLDRLRTGLDLARAGGVHHVRPAVVSLTQATEWGTTYRVEEIATLAEVAHGAGLKVHVDGARLANAIAYLGCTPAAATWRAGVDILSLGATKNGALAAEAVVVFDRTLAAGFAERRKRAGHLLSKMRFVSAQLVASLEQGRWLSYAAHANRMAHQLASALSRLPGIRLVEPVEANELFLAMPEPLIAMLHAEGFVFYRWIAPPGETNPVVRLVTSFATEPSAIDALVSATVRLTAPDSAPR